MTATTETWHARDLPFLTELVNQLDEYPQTWITGYNIAQALSLSDSDALRALAHLKRGGHVITKPVPRRSGDGPLDEVLDVTETALYAVSVWPTPETALDRMLAALDKVAQNTDDTDTRTNAQRTAACLRSSATTVGLTVASAMITGQLPGASS